MFSVEKGAIRYGLAAIKGIGQPVQEAIVEERNKRGPYTSLKNFIERLTGKEVNKRTLENFIKAGAFELGQGSRKQYMMVYQVLTASTRRRKNSMMG